MLLTKDNSISIDYNDNTYYSNNSGYIKVPFKDNNISLSLNINKCASIDASSFNIENIKISELYSLASEQIDNNEKTTTKSKRKWRCNVANSRPRQL